MINNDGYNGDDSDSNDTIETPSIDSSYHSDSSVGTCLSIGGTCLQELIIENAPHLTFSLSEVPLRIVQDLRWLDERVIIVYCHVPCTTDADDYSDDDEYVWNIKWGAFRNILRNNEPGNEVIVTIEGNRLFTQALEGVNRQFNWERRSVSLNLPFKAYKYIGGKFYSIYGSSNELDEGWCVMKPDGVSDDWYPRGISEPYLTDAEYMEQLNVPRANGDMNLMATKFEIYLEKALRPRYKFEVAKCRRKCRSFRSHFSPIGNLITSVRIDHNNILGNDYGDIEWQWYDRLDEEAGVYSDELAVSNGTDCHLHPSDHTWGDCTHNPLNLSDELVPFLLSSCVNVFGNVGFTAAYSFLRFGRLTEIICAYQESKPKAKRKASTFTSPSTSKYRRFHTTKLD
jgi:hypothetical protein